MRREGRQHGMVVHREIYSGFNKPKTRLLNELKTVPTTKFMTRVSSKPTNHSRYTGRWFDGCLCPRCGDRNATLPINKSRVKAKGAHKFRHYNDVTVNHLLVSQRLVGSANRAHWVRFNHGSANGLLSQFTDHDYGDLDIDCHDEFDEDYDVFLDDHEVGGNHGENGLIGEKQEQEEVIFQEKGTGRRLGIGTWDSRLWYMDREGMDSALSSIVESAEGVERSVEDLLLLHHRA